MAEKAGADDALADGAEVLAGDAALPAAASIRQVLEPVLSKRLKATVKPTAGRRRAAGSSACAANMAKGWAASDGHRVSEGGTGPGLVASAQRAL